jgi:hypothetical protein
MSVIIKKDESKTKKMRKRKRETEKRRQTKRKQRKGEKVNYFSLRKKSIDVCVILK